MSSLSKTQIAAGSWLELPYDRCRDTIQTLHMELQIIGKLRLALSPLEPQWANVPLYLTARGLTTTPMLSGDAIFAVDVDLIDHQVTIAVNDGRVGRVALRERPVADFYREFIDRLREMGIEVRISTMPSEVPDPIRFDQDRTHSAYEPEWATRFFQVLSRIDLVLKRHRAAFRGRTSLVNFFWGTFDLSLTRYSGRRVEAPAGAGVIHRVSADAEAIAVGFWPGNTQVPMPAFFGYAYPKPDGLEAETIGPAGARWDERLGEFILPYEEVRSASPPQDALLEFCRSVYDASARLAGWDSTLVRG
jgi:hypothetical protein